MIPLLIALGYGFTPTGFVPPFVGVVYTNGVARSSTGKQGANFLDPGEPVPVYATFVGGSAFSPVGMRYICAWPADNNVAYVNGIAHRPDGAMCIVTSVVGGVYHAGVTLSNRGELFASTSEPVTDINGWGITSTGAVSMSEVS